MPDIWHGSGLQKATSGLLRLNCCKKSRATTVLQKHVDRFLGILGEETVNAICELDVDCRLGALVDALREVSDSSPHVLQCVTGVLAEYGHDSVAACSALCSRLNLSGVKNPEAYCHLVQFTDELLNVIPTETVLGRLPKTVLPDQEKEFILTTAKCVGRLEANRILLLKLPMTSLAWFGHFVHVFKQIDGISEDLKERVVSLEPVELQPAAESANSAESSKHGVITLTEEEQTQLDIEKAKEKPKAELARPVEPDIAVELRPFQEELAAPAIGGRNCLIFAPTSSGKTHVALKVIERRLRDRPSANVIFLAAKNPLVRQQADVLGRHFGLQYGVAIVTGDQPKGSDIGVFKKEKIVAMSPQILDSWLNPVARFSDERPEALSLHGISLIVFDECHHCDKRHPYSQIMAEYVKLKLKLEESSESAKPLPQILGLTAAPGVGEKARKTSDNVMGEAVDYIKSLLARLDIDCISLVREHEQAMNAFVRKARDEVMATDRPSGKLISTVEARMAEIEKMLTSRLEQIKPTLPSGLGVPKIREGRFGINYRQTLNAMRDLLKKIHDVPSKNLVLHLGELLDFLEHYHRILYLSCYVPCQRAVATTIAGSQLFGVFASGMPEEEIEARFQEDTRPVVRSAMKYIPQLPDLARDSSSPLPFALVRVLKSQFESNPQSLAAVFVQEKDLAREVQKFLWDVAKAFDKPHPMNIQNVYPCILVGHGRAERNEGLGQTAERQYRTVDDLASGDSKIVVVTTIFEEGMDLVKCNLIVQYDFTTNERGAAQRRGRIRAEDGRSVLLTFTDTKTRRQHLVNLQNEKVMREAVSRVKGETEESLRVDIRKRQIEQQRERVSEQVLGAALDLKRSNKEYQICCGHCRTVICPLSSVKTLSSYYFVMYPGVWDKVKCERIADPHRYGIHEPCAKVGSIYCRNQPCMKRLGSAFARQVFDTTCVLPLFKVKEVVFVDLDPENGKPRETFTVGQWSRVPLKLLVRIAHYSSADIRTMAEAAGQPLTPAQAQGILENLFKEVDEDD